MRITKVKIDNKQVLFAKEITHGLLEHDGKAYEDESAILDLIKEKKENFELSFLNKTLINKAPKNWEGNDKKNLNNLRALLECRLKNEHFPKDIPYEKLKEIYSTKYLSGLSKDEIKKYFHPRCVDVLNYKKGEHNAEAKKFSLSEIIFTALQKNSQEEIFNALLPYYEWYEYQKETKQEKLADSIFNNKINLAISTKNAEPSTLSTRMQALAGWAKTYANNNSIDFNELETKFKTKELFDEINRFFEKCKKTTEEEKKKNPKLILLPKDRQEFNCGIKEIYKTHRRNLCQEKVFYNNEVQQYSLEVGKYLDLYFPVKKSDKKKSFGVEYVEHYLSFETMQKSVAGKIKNAVVQYIIQQGKYLFYNKQQYTSKELQEIKAQEAFCLQFIGACAFATNNLRNVLNEKLEVDILTKKEFLETLNSCLENAKSKDFAVNKLIPFFALEFLEDDQAVSSNKENIKKAVTDNQNFIQFMAAVRTSIQSIRNNIIHFKKEAYTELLNIENFEGFLKDNTQQNKIIDCPSGNCCSYLSSYLATLMQNEVKLLPKLFAEKVKSSGLLEWYAIEDILPLCNFELFSKPLSFIPSFKKVFNYGKTQQFPQCSSNGKDGNIYDLKIYFNEYENTQNSQNLTNSSDYYQAKRNAYKFVYENIFIRDFLDKKNEQQFLKIVDAVILANKSSMKKKDEFAFAEVPKYSERGKWLTADFEENPIGYLQSLQSMLINEENKKREKGTIEEAETGHFQRFLYYLFMSAFDKYIQKDTRFDFIKKPVIHCTGTESEKTNALNKKLFAFRKQLEKMPEAIKHSIAPTKSAQIAFWTFCKMLDAKHLTGLSGQISKFKQAIAKDIVKDNSDISSNLQTCQEIIALCLLSNDTSFAKPTSKEITPYVENDAQGNAFYLQADNKTAVLRAGVKLAEKYGTKAILEAVLINHKVAITDIKNWEEAKTDIAKNTQCKEALHKEWVNIAGKDRNKWLYTYKQNKCTYELTPKAQQYLNLCKQVNTYNWLDNKVNLVHVKSLHDLLIEILARFVGFVQLWERDFQFQNEYLSHNHSHNFKKLSFSKGLPFDSKLKGNWENYIPNYFIPLLWDDKPTPTTEEPNKTTKKYRLCRNFIVHFNYLTQSAPFSILYLLAKVRSLVSYDRKLKNAVAKSFITILDRHGMEIKFKPLHENNHEFVIEHLKPKQTQHLKPKQTQHLNSKKITIDQVSEEYANMVKTLLEYSK